MNVLWIMADQMRADAVGFMGNPRVHTPNLDALAARGAVFTNTFSQSPLCTPGRTCLFTSRYVHAHGAWWNGVPPSRDRLTLPQLLRESGYRTALIGKLHFNPTDRDHGFDHKEMHEEHLEPELSGYDAFLAAQDPPGKRAGVYTDWTNRAASVGVCNMPEHLEETRWVADRTCAFLRENREQPFFLFSSFVRPHSPYNPLPRFLDLYRDADIEAPPFDAEEWDALPPRVRRRAEAHGWPDLSDADRAEALRHYYALCSQVDESIGRVVDCLEEQGLADSTVIVFCSDHGDFVGEHGFFLKEHLWDGALHVPLVVIDPRRSGSVRSDSLVESIDVMPTLLELLDIDRPDALQGRSFVPLLDSPDAPHRDAVFAEFTTHILSDHVHDLLATCANPTYVSVRTDRWKYIHYAGEPGELYDICEDPGERRNLCGDPDLEPVCAELRTRLLDWRMDSEDRTPPEPDNSYFLAYFRKTLQEFPGD